MRGSCSKISGTDLQESCILLSTKCEGGVGSCQGSHLWARKGQVYRTSCRWYSKLGSRFDPHLSLRLQVTSKPHIVHWRTFVLLAISCRNDPTTQAIIKSVNEEGLIIISSKFMFSIVLDPLGAADAPEKNRPLTRVFFHVHPVALCCQRVC